MVLVLFCFGIITLLLVILFLSSIRVKISDIEIKNAKLNDKYKIFFQIYFVNKVPIYSKKINLNYILKKRIIRNKKRNKKFNINIEKETMKDLFILEPKIEKLDLKVDLGYEDACVVSYLVGISNGLISVFLPFFTKKNNNIKYVIKPIYNRNLFNIYLDCIISIKIVHIIYVICKLLTKGRLKNERASNRRINAEKQ